eukprot:scpid50070/ scgid1046/ 
MGYESVRSLVLHDIGHEKTGLSVSDVGKLAVWCSTVLTNYNEYSAMTNTSSPNQILRYVNGFHPRALPSRISQPLDEVLNLLPNTQEGFAPLSAEKICDCN